MAYRDLRQRQLFIDDEIIEHQTLLERVVHQPARPPGNPVLTPQMPWEGDSIEFLAGVYGNPTQEQFRMWYVCNASVDRYRHFVCIAESNDGTHWSRPDLDCYRNLTDGPNNIVYATSQKLDGPTILHDPDDPNSWKLVFYRGGSVFVGESKDGIQWQMPDEQDQPVLPNFGDRTTSLLDAPSQEPIVIFSRDRDDMQQLQKVRCIYRIGLSDPRTVRSQSQLILRPDLEDGPYVEFYQMSAFRYESVFLGFIERTTPPNRHMRTSN